MDMKFVGIGVGILVKKSGRILFMKRNSSHGFGTWAPPGGHIDFGESPEDAAYRECLEETGVYCKNIKFITYTNDYFQESNKHYVTLWFEADWDKGEAKINSPDEVQEVRWLDIKEVPKPFFLPLENLFRKNTFIIN